MNARNRGLVDANEYDEAKYYVIHHVLRRRSRDDVSLCRAKAVRNIWARKGLFKIARSPHLYPWLSCGIVWSEVGTEDGVSPELNPLIFNPNFPFRNHSFDRKNTRYYPRARRLFGLFPFNPNKGRTPHSHSYWFSCDKRRIKNLLNLSLCSRRISPGITAVYCPVYLHVLLSASRPYKAGFFVSDGAIWPKLSPRFQRS